MRLSDAILLGDTLKIRSAGTWIDGDNSCGCALGGALLAVNIAEAFHKSSQIRPSDLPEFKSLWPWFTSAHEAHVSGLFARLCDEHKGSIEEIAAYVRSIEPAEEPEYIPDEEPWTDSKTTAEMMNSIKGR